MRWMKRNLRASIVHVCAQCVCQLHCVLCDCVLQSPLRTLSEIQGICSRAHPLTRHQWLLKCTRLRPPNQLCTGRVWFEGSDLMFLTGGSIR